MQTCRKGDFAGIQFQLRRAIIRFDHSMADDLIDPLKPPKSAESDSGESNTQPDRSDAFDPELIASWNPSRRDYPNVLFITFAGFVLVCVVIVNLRHRPGGMQIVALVIYTLLIPYILSDRFLRFVPWSLLNRFRKKFLLVHCLALAVIYGMSTFAFSVKRSLPVWFITAGRKPSLFNYCLGGILLALAYCECSWISAHKGRDTSEAKQY